MYAAMRPGNPGFGNLIDLSRAARQWTLIFLLFPNSWRLYGYGLLAEIGFHDL